MPWGPPGSSEDAIPGGNARLSTTAAAIRPAREAKPAVERFERPAVPADLSKPSRTYRASEEFVIGERIDHPSFGQGVVETAEPGKITVFFASGRRVLVQSKEGAASSKLERPKPFDHSNTAGGKPVGEA